MKLTYLGQRNWFPQGVMPKIPPILGQATDYQIGFNLNRIVAEYWTAKTIRVHGSVTDQASVTCTFDQSFSANGARIPAQRVIPGWDALAISGLPPGYSGGVQINWPQVYKNLALYYPYIVFKIGSFLVSRTRSDLAVASPLNPSGVVVTAFGQNLACWDSPPGEIATPSTGSVIIETTEYWT